MKLLLLYLSLLLILAIGCSPAPDARPKQEISELQERITGLEARMPPLSNEVRNLAKAFHTHKYFEHSATHSITITPDQEGFQTLDSGFARFFVSTENVTPYLDGYRVTLQIGNPYYASFTGFKLFTSWGIIGAADVADYKFRTNEYTEVLKPGTWTSVSFLLTPATAAELRNADVQIETSVINLMPVKR